jgi:hypothetical protein
MSIGTYKRAVSVRSTQPFRSQVAIQYALQAPCSVYKSAGDEMKIRNFVSQFEDDHDVHKNIQANYCVTNKEI